MVVRTAGVVRPDENRRETDQNADESEETDAVAVDNARQHYREALTNCHDDRERHRAKLGDREVDEELADRRRERHDCDVRHEGRMADHE